ncbi:putative disease resistance protein At1g50180 [Coffea eugenioides]|uniref:putative disease resistance protein At1g50180 n=1 Tax=Coffea eugenioides TaxID=49369 RepID=UPI000F613B38|nr:putative disease resistance protein At1g50180 [Coffea eugenioides]
MAEAAVSLVIDKLSNLLIQQTVQQIVFLKNVPEQIQSLKTLLIDIQCFLKFADEQQDDNPMIRNWVSKLRDAAYESEDVIETFIVKMQALKKKGFWENLSCFPKRLLCLYKVGKNIESIQKKMLDIEKSRLTFGIDQVLGEGTSTRGEELRKLLRSSPFTEDKDLVGLEEKTNSLVAQLLVQDSSGRVISIVGMAGVGKTTLARKVYNHVDVIGYFNCRAWVYVSQKCSAQEVLVGIIKQVEKQTKESLDLLEGMQEADLERMVREKLQDKCYLVVLDDIWEEEAWDSLAAAFPNVNNGSRLLMTSRYEKVPRYADALSKPYKLETLGEEDGWQLFLKKALAHGLTSESKLPPDLEAIGRKIVERCDGLPLAITVIGRLLQGKSEWKSVLDTLTDQWSRGRKGVSAVLASSYNDLPSYLKTCFLSFAIFPEDFVIPTRKLFHMWIAEGLIHQKGVEVLEDVAADRLDELVYRNLVQVVALTANGKVKSCRVHDLLRDLAVAKAEEVMFLKIFGESSSSFPPSKCRHLLVNSCSEMLNYPGEFEHSTPPLRSLIFFNLAEVKHEFNLSFARFKLLRVLDLQNMNTSYLPEEIGELCLLMYLCLRRTRIKRLPLSLGCLQNLQTLDIYIVVSVVEVPNVLWKLKNLRHLYIRETIKHVPLKFDTLKNLQTLCDVYLDTLIGNKMMLLTSMRKLGVWIERSSRIDELFSSIAKLENLVHLELVRYGEEGFPSLIGLSHLNYVNRLRLSGWLTELPSPHNFPPRLSHLSLLGTKLAEDPMPTLEKLEHLSILKLKNAYAGKELVISDNQFPNLTVLQLEHLPNLIEIKIGRGAMPQLRCLRISNCYFVEMLPEELRFMEALEKVEVEDMPKRFITRLHGMDSYKKEILGFLVSQVDDDNHSNSNIEVLGEPTAKGKTLVNFFGLDLGTRVAKGYNFSQCPSHDNSKYCARKNIEVLMIHKSTLKDKKLSGTSTELPNAGIFLFILALKDLPSPVVCWRILIFFNVTEVEHEFNLSFARFKLLRALDLENMNISYLPEEIGELSLLSIRKLGVRIEGSSGIDELFGSIAKLENLVSLVLLMDGEEGFPS